ncbi:1-deoxy-D-xylulose 5-phosphate reductoisomerase [Thiovulum sp. ES]|nr:1-deoxy-D-xylulose 5-phosphate reductoisomerase [Thiovulum sp. ES]
MIILGSTGSIGKNTLLIAKDYEQKVEVLTTFQNVELLNKQIAEFSPKIVVVGKEEFVKKVNHERVYFGENGILRAIEEAKSEVVVNALVGFSGLKPTLKTLELGKKLALANKESLVNAGKFIDTSKIAPIDSEHFALWYLLNNRKISKMILTASGGAFRDWEISKIQNATSSEALNHPNWKMGKKITVDSASMVNKLFEVLEAHWLFGTKNIDAMIEKKSIFHGMIEFADGSTTAHISGTDMKLPIAYALFGKIEKEILKPVNLLKMGTFHFSEISKERYPLWNLKDELLKNPEKGAILNSANDFFVKMFLENRISFGEMSSGILDCFDNFENRKPKSIDEVFQLDSEIKSAIQQKFQ